MFQLCCWQGARINFELTLNCRNLKFHRNMKNYSLMGPLEDFVKIITSKLSYFHSNFIQIQFSDFCIGEFAATYAHENLKTRRNVRVKDQSDN